MNDIKKFEPELWEFKTYDGRGWNLTQRQYDVIKQKMTEGKQIYEMPDGSLIAKGNLKAMEKRQVTMADMNWGDKKALPVGERVINKDGPGFKKFVLAAKKLNPNFYRRKMAEWGMDENGTYLEKKGDTNANTDNSELRPDTNSGMGGHNTEGTTDV